MTYRVRNIVLAVGLALLAALLTTFYVTNYKKHVQSQEQTVPVLVAKQNIPAGTLGSDVVKKHWVSIETVPRKSFVPGALANAGAIQNQIVVQPIYAGEQVTARRFGPVQASGVRSQLTGIYRDIQIAGDKNQLLVGTLKAGDHVDFLGNIKIPDEGSQKHFARIVLRDLVVLKVSSDASGVAKATAPTQAQDWVQLRVTDSQSQKLFFTYVNDDWALTLRPALNSADSPNSMEDAISVISAGIQNAAQRLTESFVLGAKVNALGQGQGRQ
jgi:Flp pilus assembly protein CpaB